MHILIKFPLLVVLNVLWPEIVVPGHVFAMTPQRLNATTVPMAPSMSVSVNVADPLPLEGHSVDDPLILAARIRTDLWMSLRGIQSEQQVASIGGRVLSMSTRQVDTMLTAVSADETTVETSLSALQQQLSSEIEDIQMEISLLDPSTDNLATAISSVNELVLSLDSAQLSVVIESPTFMAL